MTPALRQAVWDRATGHCEYCHLLSDYHDAQFEIDHILSGFHFGRTVASHLALSCYWCNHFKGTNVAGIDPATSRITRLFHPRRHRWDKHFRWEGAILVGRTEVGRTTVRTLRMNMHFRVALRRLLIVEGGLPRD